MTDTDSGAIYAAAKAAQIRASQEFDAWRALVENHARHAHLYLVADSYQTARRWCIDRGISVQWRPLFIATTEYDLFGVRFFPNDRLVRLHRGESTDTRRVGLLFDQVTRMLHHLDEHHRTELLELEEMTNREHDAAEAARAEWIRRNG